MKYSKHVSIEMVPIINQRQALNPLVGSKTQRLGLPIKSQPTGANDWSIFKPKAKIEICSFYSLVNNAKYSWEGLYHIVENKN